MARFRNGIEWHNRGVMLADEMSISTVKGLNPAIIEYLKIKLLEINCNTHPTSTGTCRECQDPSDPYLIGHKHLVHTTVCKRHNLNYVPGDSVELTYDTGINASAKCHHKKCTAIVKVWWYNEMITKPICVWHAERKIEKLKQKRDVPVKSRAILLDSECIETQPTQEIPDLAILLEIDDNPCATQEPRAVCEEKSTQGPELDLLLIALGIADDEPCSAPAPNEEDFEELDYRALLGLDNPLIKECTESRTITAKMPDGKSCGCVQLKNTGSELVTQIVLCLFHREEKNWHHFKCMVKKCDNNAIPKINRLTGIFQVSHFCRDCNLGKVRMCVEGHNDCTLRDHKKLYKCETAGCINARFFNSIQFVLENRCLAHILHPQQSSS